MNKLVNIIKKISSLGVNENMPIYEQKATILFNQIIRIMSLMLIIGAVIFYITMDYKIVPTLFLLSTIVIAISLFLNLKGKVKISLLIISIFFPVFFLAISIISKTHGETNNLFFYIAPRFGIILITIVCYIIIGLGHPVKAIFSVIFGAIVYIFYDRVHIFYGIDVKNFPLTDWDYNMIIFEIWGVAMVFILISTFLQRVNSNYEKIITEKNNKLTEQNEEIKQQNEEIRTQRDEIEKHRDIVVEKNEKIEYQNKEIKDSIIYASRIQKAILGTSEEIIKQLKNSFIYFRPHSIVSGDFYWFTEISKNNKDYKILIAADCTGHGVPGAFMTVLGHDSLDEIINNHKIISPKEILIQLDKNIVEKLKKNQENQVNDGMDISILTFNFTDKKVTFAAAKNPLYYVRNNEMNVIKGSKFAIGGNDLKNKIFEEHIFDLKKNDMFYIFSDGFQDQFGGEKNHKYMTKRFREFLFSISNEKIKKQSELIDFEFNNWKNDKKQTDDVLIVGFRYEG